MRKTFAMLVKAALTLAFIAAPVAASGQVRYRVTQLAEPAGTTVCVPTAMNDNGDVVGYCHDAVGSFGVVWRAGVAQALGKWSGGTYTQALAIGSSGQIVGIGDEDGDPASQALAWVGGRWVQIDGSGGSSQQALGVTTDGVIFGNYTTTGSPGNLDWDPVYWTLDPANASYRRTDLPKPLIATPGAFIYAATKGGIAVGQVRTAAGDRAALWNDDATHSLVVLGISSGFNSAAAFGVSDDGRAAGAAYFGDTKQNAMLWQNDGTHTPVTIGVLEGDLKSEAFAVNNAGQVVGASIGSSNIPRGFLFQNGAIAALTTLIDAADAGWTINEAVGIDNAGRIIAVGARDGRLHPVMLVPTVVAAPKVSSVTLSADHTAPQVAGTTVTFTASATGGVAPIQFKWLLYDGSTTTMIRDWSTTATFAWRPATANPSYRVTVWARSNGNSADAPESAASMAFAITAPPPPAGSLPAPWSTRDIGAVGVAGSASHATGTFTVKGAGADVWGTADAFRFVYQSLPGDGDIVARVASVQNVAAWVKAGVMIRQGLDAGSAHAFMLVSAARGLAFQRRTQAGGTSTHTSGGTGTAPAWVKLARRGQTITASRSADGVAWSQVGQATIALTGSVYVGLAVSSHDTTRTATALFDQVKVTQAAALPAGWQSHDVGSVGLAGKGIESGGTFTLKGAGADVWGTADAFHYAYRSLSGDGTIIAKVATIQGTQAWTKIGVMMRGGTAANAAHAFMVVTLGKGLAFQRRTTAGGISTHTSGGAGTAPRWLKLARVGNVVTASVSTDGLSWNVVGSDTISLPANILVGLAVSSHTTSALATATFTNVTVQD
jgi:probable HAF family extracellular repeat protein